MKVVIVSIFFTLKLFAGSYGALLLEGNCITCHHYTKDISAPSLKLIKQRYLDVYPNKEDFVSMMSNWVLHPNKDTSIMVDMIDKYELMPELGYDIDTLIKITTYIYNSDLN